MYGINYEDQKENIEKEAKDIIHESLNNEDRIVSIKNINVQYLDKKKLHIIIEIIPVDYPEPLTFDKTLDFN